ncbi:MAG: integration host factor subunit alpha [Desulfatiglandales bacterium]
MTLTKQDFIQNVSKNLRMPQNDSAELVETLLELIKTTLASGEGLVISRFGKFSVLEKKSRRGRNPYTGDDLTLGARRVVSFKPSGVLRKKLNGKG